MLSVAHLRLFFLFHLFLYSALISFQFLVLLLLCLGADRNKLYEERRANLLYSSVNNTEVLATFLSDQNKGRDKKTEGSR